MNIINTYEYIKEYIKTKQENRENRGKKEIGKIGNERDKIGEILINVFKMR